MNWQAGEIMFLLRRQRHDFINHIQVISGYIQLKKSEQALAYLKQVQVQMDKTGRLMHLAHPDLALISLAKIEAASAGGILVDLDIHTNMKDLALEIDVASCLWKAAWDLALALTGEGGTLKVTMSCKDNYYLLQFRTPDPAPVPKDNIVNMEALSKRYKIPFEYRPERGEIGILMASK